AHPARRPHPGPHPGLCDLRDAHRRRPRSDLRRRHALRRVDRAHRPAGRRYRADDGQPARHDLDARRLRRRPARTRPHDDDRAGAGVEPVLAGSRRPGPRTVAVTAVQERITPFAAPKGVPEYTPTESDGFEPVRDTLAAAAARAGYGLIELPVFEDTGLYARGVGESTDV